MDGERDVVPSQAIDLAEYRPVLDEVFCRIKRSVKKRGDWLDYGVADVFEAVAGEFDEYREAFVGQVVAGRHGQIEELLDVAVTAIKGVVRLRAEVG